LYTFCSQGGCPIGSAIASLIQAPNCDFYCLTPTGGHVNQGSLFQLTPSGVVRLLLSIYVERDGHSPGNLVLAGDGSFYFTVNSEAYGSGRVLHFDSQGISVVHEFVYTDGYPPYTLRTGLNGNVYGTAASGGTDTLGDIFEVSVSSGFSFLYSLTGSYEGATPTSVLLGSVTARLPAAVYPPARASIAAPSSSIRSSVRSRPRSPASRRTVRQSAHR